MNDIKRIALTGAKIFAGVTIALAIVITFIAGNVYWTYGADAMIFRGFFAFASILLTAILTGIVENAL